MIRIICIAATLLLATAARADELAPTGTLRATFLGTNPVQGRLDPATGEVRGPAGDIARELAKRHGVALTITALIGVPAVIASVKEGQADIGFAAFDTQRAIEVDFSQSYSLAYNSYLVPASSPLRSQADIDKPGVRIGVGKSDAADLFLSRTLKQAELKRGEARTIDALVKVMTSGEIDAYAGNRQRLIEAQVLLPNTRILADNFLAVEQAIIVAKGNPARLAIVDRFLDEARASGFIRAALNRAGLSGVDVAPKKK